MSDSEGGKKQEKHVGFDEAINYLEREVGNLGTLVDRVCGKDKAKEPASEPKTPHIALSDFIAHGAERIENIRNQLVEHKNTLRELLF